MIRDNMTMTYTLRVDMKDGAVDTLEKGTVLRWHFSNDDLVLAWAHPRHIYGRVGPNKFDPWVLWAGTKDSLEYQNRVSKFETSIQSRSNPPIGR